MWRQDDLVRSARRRVERALDYGPERRPRRGRATLASQPGIAHLPGLPADARHRLLHRARRRCRGGGCDRHARRAATSTPIELLDTIERESVNTHGDRRRRVRQADPAGARRRARPVGPLEPASSITSSGVMWSARRPRRACCATTPGMMLIDAFSSSEAIGMGQSVSTAGGRGRHGQVHARRRTRGSSPTTAATSCRARARSAGSRSAAAARSATTRTRRRRRATFVDDRRRALLDPRRLRHGRGRRHRSRLLGRGSVCINTGGEKVFPEEVEEVLKTAPDRARRRRRRRARRASSARPSPRSSRPAPGDALDEADADRPRARPSWRPTRRRSGSSSVDTIGRAANGKVDYKRLKAYAVDRLTAGA